MEKDGIDRRIIYVFLIKKLLLWQIRGDFLDVIS